ncbi:TetR/AcrR family transcriptional regulator C-terminal domain-containing protein [Chloroflexota bacterium]|nr:TetR/AcrR family transcriptional regulator C-terminal domain-containing protein [Chloroflexota bacterium]
MIESGIDPRVLRTQRALIEALKRLVEKKPFSKLSIKEITAEAGVDRTTFYLHFHGIHELMDALALDLFAELHQAIYCRDQSEFSQKSEDLKDYVEIVFIHLEKHRAFYRSVLSNKGDPYFKDLFQAMLSELLFKPMAASLHFQADSSSELIICFYVSGFTGITAWWLEKNIPIDARKASKEISEKILPGYLQLLG